MQSIFRVRVMTVMLAFLHTLAQVTLTLPAAAWAQDIDTDPPVIEFKPVEEGIRGDSQVFTATVTDDNGVESVMLHYRVDGESLYQNRQMESLGETDFYTTSLSTDETVQSIEYYIEAIDLAGNRTLQGFAFDPIERQLVERAAATVVQTSENAPAAAGLSTRNKVLYGVLGLLVVGALASAASSGGGGGGSSSPGVDVTVIVEPLP